MNNKSENIVVLAVGIRGGGAETYLRELLPELQKISMGHIYHLFVAESRKNYYNQSLPNLVIHEISDNTIDSNLHRIIYENITICKEIRKIQPIICFCAGEVFSPFLKFLKIPIINVYHAAMQFYMKPKVDESRAKLLYTNIMRKLSIDIASKTIAVSHFERGEIGGRFPRHMMNKIIVVYHGLNHGVFYPPSAIDEKDLSPFPFNYILCISDRHRHKKMDEMISIFAIMHNNMDVEEHLVIIGRSKSKLVDETIAGLIEENNLKEYVHLIDYIDNKNLRRYYWHAKLYWTNSAYESFGLTPLEAMACGTPVLSAWRCSLPEIYGEAAAFYNPYCLTEEEIANIAKDILKDEKLLSLYSEKGILHSKKFQWSKAAQEYSKIIEREIDKC